MASVMVVGLAVGIIGGLAFAHSLTGINMGALNSIPQGWTQFMLIAGGAAIILPIAL